MATDYWPQEEGCIFDANAYIVPCYPDGAIGELGAVAMGTTVAGRISVIAVGAAVTGDGVAVALRAATGAGVPTRIPVLFYGAVKLTSTSINGYFLQAGSFVMNNGLALYQSTTGEVLTTLRVGGGSSYVLGLCLQGASGAGGDGSECVVLVGKTY